MTSLWYTSLLPELRDVIRQVLREDEDFGSIASLRMTCLRENQEIQVFLKNKSKYRVWPGYTFVEYCFRLQHYPLMIWGLQVYPQTTFSSTNSRSYSIYSGDEFEWEIHHDIAVNVALPDGDDDDI